LRSVDPAQHHVGLILGEALGFLARFARPVRLKLWSTSITRLIAIGME
jgi:hypothetical protein